MRSPAGGDTYLGGMVPSRNNQMLRDVATHEASTTQVMTMYALTRCDRFHDRNDWRTALVKSKAATAMEDPKKKAATSKPVLDVSFSLYQGGTSVPMVGIGRLSICRRHVRRARSPRRSLLEGRSATCQVLM